MLDPRELERTKAAESELEFSKARQLLVDLIALPDLQAVFDDQDCVNAKRVYTQAPTLALLILQRLGGGLTLTAAVQELIQHHRDLLPNNRRVEEGTLSENNSAYNQARQKLPLKKVEAFSNAICDHLAAHCEPAWQGSRVMILDGTTITSPPTPELKKAFPPATNQHGESVWPVAMLMVASEMATGSVLVPEVDAMYGENNSSEAAQAERIIDRLPHDALVLADSGFGIFRVAYHCKLRNKEFVLRLTASRFKSLQKKATLIEDDEGFRTRRYDVEFDIRDLKVTMDTENLRAKKLDTVMKELLGSVIAYNLVTQFRRQSAKLARVKPRRLSFSGVWLTFQHHLLYAPVQSFEQWQATYAAALVSGAGRKLPNRPDGRSSPRIAHPRRPKTTKFQKSLRKKEKQKPPD